MSDNSIELRGVTKRFDNTVAVDDLSLTVKDDETYGFLGPNGAGKSTTISMLLDYQRPTEGTARVLGQDPQTDGAEVRAKIGNLPDQYSTYNKLSARRHLQFVIDTKGVDDDPERLLERVGLTDVINEPAGTFSQGMKQRLALAMALVGEPELLILDEPFTGLDPHGVRTVRDIVQAERERDTAVFFSSHILGQVELVCDRIGILHNGRLIAEGTLDELRANIDADEDASIEDIFVAYTHDSVRATTEGVR
ncbi:ABC transporter ATP-binding protein [Halocatena pleomorpha]|uniref:ABC transporter ATP-binding protein n=1 Tax=Halocatena pleomorpha TaxID=1785090 RepID=A0A3P3RFT6_9EURY|nr:ABC transporter ATP-binding protein [Halocatena pleomorpha]RRJ31293.1 ABC transporter ATP-binding protein [Halocatena pleomorpha]